MFLLLSFIPFAFLILFLKIFLTNSVLLNQTHIENRMELMEKISSERINQKSINEKVQLADTLNTSMVEKVFLLANMLIILHKKDTS